MKNKILKTFFFLLLLVGSSVAYAGTCLVDTNPVKNRGWCVETVEGPAACIELEVENAGKCSKDNTQPE
ncbi:hypothetical protein [uncultured Roseivirga sp.]|uniref:hypothetical protein n=1 Tax=uncultured Roseivirga sp. TaxID=543088 RepID=UPI0030DA5AD4|tara:strand:- start:40387 stop:40593 length:207 start_codon:yes stop_codon:yes gene_type:complete